MEAAFLVSNICAETRKCSSDSVVCVGIDVRMEAAFVLATICAGAENNKPSSLAVSCVVNNVNGNKQCELFSIDVLCVGIDICNEAAFLIANICAGVLCEEHTRIIHTCTSICKRGLYTDSCRLASLITNANVYASAALTHILYTCTTLTQALCSCPTLTHVYCIVP